jgi:hypothetical protein
MKRGGRRNGVISNSNPGAVVRTQRAEAAKAKDRSEALRDPAAAR